MALINLILLAASMFALMESAQFATRYASRLAKSFHLSEFIISFFIVALISVFPETAISIISAIDNVPELGLGTLLGSNVADLTLVMGIVVLVSENGIKVKSQVLREKTIFVLLLLAPLVLGIDGYFSRIDGLILVLSGLFFFYKLSIDGKMFQTMQREHYPIAKNLILLAISLSVLMISAHYAIKYCVNFANAINVSPMIINLTVISVGTCLPELIFSIKSVRSNHEGLALGDLLGTVVTDATLIIGIIALIMPFSFNAGLIYVTGVLMFLAGAITIVFMETDRTMTKKEALVLLCFYIIFLAIELLIR